MTEVFDTALLMLDEQDNPVILIPRDLPQGNIFLNIVHDGIDIGVDGQVHGSLRDMEEEELTLLGQQQTVAMSTFDLDKDESIPDTIEYVATVKDLRAKKQGEKQAGN